MDEVRLKPMRPANNLRSRTLLCSPLPWLLWDCGQGRGRLLLLYSKTLLPHLILFYFFSGDGVLEKSIKFIKHIVKYREPWDFYFSVQKGLACTSNATKT